MFTCSDAIRRIWSLFACSSQFEPFWRYYLHGVFLTFNEIIHRVTPRHHVERIVER